MIGMLLPERMTDEEILQKFPRNVAVEILLKRYESYLWKLAKTIWDHTLGNEYVPLEDLVSAARMGLVKAAYAFDPNKNVSFLTFLVTVANNQILHEVRNFMPISFKNLRTKTKEEKAEIAEVLTNMGSLETPAGESLDDGDDAELLCEKIADIRATEEMEKMVRHHTLRLAVKCLPPLERKVITLIYGLSDGMPKTFREVAQILGYPLKSIYNIHERALRKLRKMLM